jgi:hypothetical protein
VLFPDNNQLLFSSQYFILTMAIYHLANSDSGHTVPVTSIDVLIVGTGPAGAALAAFLANYGMLDLRGPWEKVLTSSKKFVEL